MLYSLFVGDAQRRRFHLLYADAARAARSFDWELVLETLEARLRLFVAEFAQRRVFVHAGVVAWRGRALLLPGRSMSGKTTLVAELVRAGARYYSDEYAVLDAQGRVHPFAQPLQLRAPGETRQTKHAVAEFGGRAGVKPLPVALVVVSQYAPDAVWRPRTVTPGQGVLELLAHTVSARRAPAVAITTLQRVTTQAPVWKSKRGEATAAAAQLLNWLDSPAPGTA